MLLQGYERELRPEDVGLGGFFDTLASGLKSGVKTVFGAAVNVGTNAAYSYLGVQHPATGGGGGTQTPLIIQQQAPPPPTATAGLPKWAIPAGLAGVGLLVFMLTRKPTTAHNPRRRRRPHARRRRR